MLFSRCVFEHIEIFAQLSLKVLSKRQCKSHNKPLFGSSLLSFNKNSPFCFQSADYYLFFSCKKVKNKSRVGPDLRVSWVMPIQEFIFILFFGLTNDAKICFSITQVSLLTFQTPTPSA